MSLAIFSSFEAGAIYALMALGVYLSFRILDFPDLTVDGSFVTGASVAAYLIVEGHDPFLATGVALIAGFVAGSLTGILHTKGNINPLLAGILMMIALYSINLRIMGRSNVPLLNEETVMTKLTSWWQSLGLDNSLSFIGFTPKTWAILTVMTVLAFVVKFLLDSFLRTDLGLALRATGDNEPMIRSFSGNTDILKIVGLGLSNALVAFSGALVAQYNGFSDAGMGIGIIIIGLASVIIGEAVFGTKSIARATLAVIGGSILYKLIVSLALRVEFLETSDMKLITALIVIGALVIPKIVAHQRVRAGKKKRLKQRMYQSIAKSGEQLVTAKSDL